MKFLSLLTIAIFSFNLTAGAAMLCCLDFESNSANVENHTHSDDMHHACQGGDKDDDKKDKDKQESEKPEEECCNSLSVCKIQFLSNQKEIKLSKSFHKQNYKFSNQGFISNNIEPLKEPPKFLL